MVGRVEEICKMSTSVIVGNLYSVKGKRFVVMGILDDDNIKVVHISRVVELADGIDVIVSNVFPGKGIALRHTSRVISRDILGISFGPILHEEFLAIQNSMEDGNEYRDETEQRVLAEILEELEDIRIKI